MTEAEVRTRARNTKRNSPYQKPFYTPVGRKITVDLLEPLAAIFAVPDTLPQCLDGVELDPWEWAWLALSPTLDAIFRGWNYEERSELAKLKLRIGENARWRLKQDNEALRWGETERLHAGHWLLGQALRLTDVFECDRAGLPHFTEKWATRASELRKYMLTVDPVYAPHLSPPAPWSGWSKQCDGFETTFVRCWRPETRKLIEDNFPQEHAAGVNALAAVPLTIDPVMVELAERFAVELMGNKGKQRKADQIRVAADVADAEWIIKNGGTFWNDYSCDRRGRIYSLQNLNFGREDHVRSMFRFANGMPLNDLHWLQNHCAKCHGETEKEPEAARIKWVEEHLQDILDIANDPFGTFEKWKDAESPFAYVAACRELAAARRGNFITHLPVGYDGSANGLQHLSLLKLDVIAASKVNLMPPEFLSDGDIVCDVYTEIIDKAIALINVDDSDHACWWRSVLYSNEFSGKRRRKLLKTPILAFGYCVTLRGATRQISRVYYLKLHQSKKPPKGAFGYLADKVLSTCADELPGPTEVMEYIQKCAEHRAKSNRFLEWHSPSGFPVVNRYNAMDFKRINCKSGNKKKPRTTHKIAVATTDAIDDKAITSAPANYVHSLDASHLIKVVNTAVSEGITDLLSVHDCYYTHAARGTRLRQIILKELRDMYRNDPLAELGARNDPERPVPPKGTPYPTADGIAYMILNLEDLPNSPNAFT